MTKLTENPEDELNTTDQSESGLGVVISKCNVGVIDLLDNGETENKKKFIFKLKFLLKYDICKNNVTNSLQAFIDKYVIGGVVKRKVNIDLSKTRYKIDRLKKNQLIHANRFNLHKSNYEVSSYIEKPINLKDIELLQSNLIIHINKLALFLKRFSAYLGKDIFSDKKQLILDENTFTLNGMDLLFDAYFVVYGYKKLNKELLEHIKSIMEIIYIMQKVLIYINTSSLLNDTGFHGSISDEQEQKLLGLFTLFRHLINKEKELSNTSIEKNFLLNITGLDSISNDSVKGFGNSILLDDLKSVEENSRNKIVSALLVGPKFLLRLEKLDNPLYNYLKGLDEATLDRVINFFINNKIEFTQEQFLFIFENNLFDSKIVTKKQLLEKAKTLFDNGVSIDDITLLNSEQFEILPCEKDIKNTKDLINLFLDDSEKLNDYKIFLEEKKSLIEKLKFIHKSASGYKELLKLTNLDFTSFSNSKDYIKEIKQLFLDNDLHNIYERNKSILLSGDSSIDELDEIYLILGLIDGKILGKIIVNLFSLNKDDFLYLKNFLISFKGSNEDYYKFIKGKYVGKILKTKELIDIHIELNKGLTLKSILVEVDNEIDIQSKSSNKISDTDKEINDLELSEEDRYINNKFKNKKELELAKKISNSLNGYRKMFAMWLKKHDDVSYNNLENIYNLINFFISRGIKTFGNISKSFELVYKLGDESKQIDFINNTFIDIRDFKNIEELNKVIIGYLEKNEDIIIIDYYDKITKLSEIKGQNDGDKFLAEIFEEGEKDMYNKIGCDLANIIQELYDGIHPKFLTSTTHNDSGKGTGLSSYILRSVFIRNLLLKSGESFSNYFTRIITINFRDLAYLILPEHGNNKLYERASHTAIDKSYMFFEAMTEFLEILKRYQDENDKIEISQLLNRYKSLLDDGVKKFNKKYGLRID